MKPTKRQIQIVEHFVKKTTKSMLNEAQPKLHGQPITSAKRKLELFIYSNRQLVKTNPAKLIAAINKKFPTISKNQVTYLIQNADKLG